MLRAEASCGPEQTGGVGEGAAKKARFPPTLLPGTAVEAAGVIDCNFVLRQTREAFGPGCEPCCSA